MKHILLGLLCLLVAATSLAQEDIYSFSSEDNRDAFDQLTQELRCPKCLNQNLADSDSEISKIMRDVIAEEIEAGQNEEDIKQMMVDRYSEFVLYDPPIKRETMILWVTPIIILILGIIAFVIIIVKRQSYLLAEAEQAQVDEQNQTKVEDVTNTSNTET